MRRTPEDEPDYPYGWRAWAVVVFVFTIFGVAALPDAFGPGPFWLRLLIGTLACTLFYVILPRLFVVVVREQWGR